jgi:hypothetical protein
VIGEYIAKIYDEIKARPAYLIEATAGLGNGEAGDAAAPAAIADPADFGNGQNMASNRHHTVS